MKKLAALLLLIVLLAGFLLHLAELLDVHCETDADCRPPTACRLLCRRNCKSVCILVLPDGEEETADVQIQPKALPGTVASAHASLKLADSPNWTVQPPVDLGVLAATQQKRKQAKSVLETEKASDEEKPFETDANPFAAAAVPFRSPNSPLPRPEKKPKEPTPSAVTPLTISEAELEAELRQLQREESKQNNGPEGFVTAPGSAEADRATTPDPFELKGTSREQLFATAPPRNRGSGRTQSSGGGMARQLVLSTSMELVGDESLFRRRTTLGIGTTVSPPSFSPQPPGLMPSPTSPSLRSSTKPPASSSPAPLVLAPPPPSKSFFPSSSSTPRTSTAAGLLPLGRHPPSQTERSKESPYSGEDFERQKAGFGKQQFYKSAEKISPWFPKTPLVRPVGATTLSPFLAAMRRTTQRVPVHRPPFGNWLRTSTPQGGPTTMRTTLKKCEAPPVCGRNCGVVIDSEGCQSCQCLWTSSRTCISDVDCRPLEGQVCDLGRCECGPGYEHHPSQSGVCVPSDLLAAALPARQRGVTLSQSSPIPASPLPASLAPALPSSLLVSGRSQHQLPLHRQFNYQSMLRRQRRRLKRAADGKPHREERLQWPGPCDSDEQCPPSLYCVEGDCWTLEPERLAQQQLQRRSKDSATIGSSPKSGVQHQPSRQGRVLGPLVGQQQTFGHKNALAKVGQAKMGGGQPTGKVEPQAAKQQALAQTSTPGQSGTVQTVTEQQPQTKKQRALAGAIESVNFSKPPLASVPASGSEAVEEGEADENEQQEQNQRLEHGSLDAIKPADPTESTPIDYPGEGEEDYAVQQQEEGKGPEADEESHTFSSSTSSSSSPPTSPETSPEASTPPPTLATSSAAPDDEGPTVTVPLPAATIALKPGEGSQPVQAGDAPKEKLPGQQPQQSIKGEAHQQSILVVHPPSARPPADFFSSTTPAAPSTSPSPSEGSPFPPQTHPDQPRRRAEFERRLSPLGRAEERPASGPSQTIPPASSTPSPPPPAPLPRASMEEVPISQHHRGLEQIPVSAETTTTRREGEALPELVGSEERRIFYDYSRRNRIRRPVRVEMINSRELMKDECHESRDCGRRFVCCLKRWCDLGGECGLAKFCLPSCELTKLAHLSELAAERAPRMDLVYD